MLSARDSGRMSYKSIAHCFIKSLIGAIAAGLVTGVIGHFTHPISTPATGLTVATKGSDSYRRLNDKPQQEENKYVLELLQLLLF